MLFDVIAPVYKKFFNYQVRMYERDFAIVEKTISLAGLRTVIGIGSGPGALCSVLQNHGFIVKGSDLSGGMRKAAMEKLRGKGIDIVSADVLNGLPFEDKSFDVAIASFVSHGLQKDDRMKMYGEMKRVASEKVIIVDYNNRSRSIITNIVEYLEGGDYFNFIKAAEAEMNRIFPKVTAIPTGIRSSWYICEVNPKTY